MLSMHYIDIILYETSEWYAFTKNCFFVQFLAGTSSNHKIPTLLKMEFEGGGVVLKFHFKIPFSQSCFLNDQYSSSFHVIGEQMKIKYLRLAPEELSTCQTEAAHM